MAAEPALSSAFEPARGGVALTRLSVSRVTNRTNPSRRHLRAIRRLLAGAAATAAALVTGVLSSPVGAQADSTAPSGPRTEFTVLASDGASLAAAVDAVESEGGTVVRSNSDVGLLTVRAPRDGFVLAMTGHDAVVGAARAQVIGHTPGAAPIKDPVENEGARSTDRGTAASPNAKGASTAGMDPLDGQLWGLRMVRSDAARTVQAGDKGVTVGILDSGIDARNPDLAPNFDWARSRNFATDNTTSTGRASSRAARTRSAGTTPGTGRTSPARSAQPPTGAGSPGSHRTSPWSRSVAARTAASCSSSPS